MKLGGAPKLPDEGRAWGAKGLGLGVVLRGGIEPVECIEDD